MTTTPTEGPDVEFARKVEERTADHPQGGGGGWLQRRYLLLGPRGTVQFLCAPKGLPGMAERAPDLHRKRVGWAQDLGYHSPTPNYDGQYRTERCPYLPLFPVCYYDGSALDAEVPLALLLDKGEEAMWGFLVEYYRAQFEDNIRPTGGFGEVMHTLFGPAQ